MVNNEYVYSLKIDMENQKVLNKIKRKIKNQYGFIGIDLQQNIYTHIEKSELTEYEKEVIKLETKSPNMEFYKLC